MYPQIICYPSELRKPPCPPSCPRRPPLHIHPFMEAPGSPGRSGNQKGAPEPRYSLPGSLGSPDHENTEIDLEGVFYSMYATIMPLLDLTRLK